MRKNISVQKAEESMVKGIVSVRERECLIERKIIDNKHTFCSSKYERECGGERGNVGMIEMMGERKNN